MVDFVEYRTILKNIKRKKSRITREEEIDVKGYFYSTWRGTFINS